MKEIATSPYLPQRSLPGPLSQGWITAKYRWLKLTHPLTPYIPRSLINLVPFVLFVYIFPFAIPALFPQFEFVKPLTSGTIIIGAGLYSIYNRYTWKELGFRKDTLFPAALAATLLSVVLLTINYLAVANHWFPRSTRHDYNAWGILYYLLISAPAQEFLFRSFLFARMKRMGVHSATMQIAVSAIVFCYLHIQNLSFFILLITFPVGLAWAVIYRKWPNFWIIAISHSLVGLLAVLTKTV